MTNRLVAIEVHYTFNPSGRPGDERHLCTVTPAGENGENAKFTATLTSPQLSMMRTAIDTRRFTYLYLPWKP